MNILSEEADRIEKKIIEDFDGDSTSMIDSLISYLQDIKKGDHEEEAYCLYSAIESAINCSFDDRHTHINRFINGAIRWQSEQIAIEEEKLTRPTQD